MRFHLLGLPQCQTTNEFAHNGFNQNVMWFARILKELGHTVFLYAGEYNQAPCDELIPCISTADQQRYLQEVKDQLATDWKGKKRRKYDPMAKMYAVHNENAAYQIAKRKQPKDFICLISGPSQKPVSDYNSDLMTVEYSIGYNKSWSPYRVFESQAMMHMAMGTDDNIAGCPWHQVIPNFFDPACFHISKKEPFALYLGRLVMAKGVSVACQIADAAGIPLKVIGGGDERLVCRGAEYLGRVSQEQKFDLLSRASVLIAPSVYAEPFGSMVVEALLSGTPVVGSNFGAMFETIDHGNNGFRCDILRDYVYGIHNLHKLRSPEVIREYAIKKYSLDAVKGQYQAYFERLMLLWDKGWDTPLAPNNYSGVIGD